MNISLATLLAAALSSAIAERSGGALRRGRFRVFTMVSFKQSVRQASAFIDYHFTSMTAVAAVAGSAR
jgi:hypothetical protein